MPKALPPPIACRTSNSPFGASSSRSILKLSTPRGGTHGNSPQIYYTSTVSTDTDSEPPSPSSPDTPVTAALAPRRRSPPPGVPRPLMRASLSRKRSTSSGSDSAARSSYFALGREEDEALEYVLSVNLPGFMPEMVTVSARRDDRLAVIADMWHSEVNCHHEWLVVFSSRDALVARARASFSADGTLSIRVPRYASPSSYAHPTANAWLERAASDPFSPGLLDGYGLR